METRKEYAENELKENGGEKTITITKNKYGVMVKDLKRLYALEAAGVDNWEGYDEAMEAMQ